MRWLIDGYNVIRRDPALASREQESLQAGREALLHILARVGRSTGDRFVAVFDGAGLRAAGQGPGAVEVLFSPPGATADDLLARLAARAGSGTAVVSSDRAVRQAAIRAGAIAVAAEEFLSRISVGPRVIETPEKDEDAEERNRPKKGNPRRPKKRERRAQRALDRLNVALRRSR